MRPLPLAAILTACLALTAQADDLPPPNLAPLPQSAPATEGATARLIEAHRLQAMGLALKDPVLLLAAARLMASVTLREVTRATAEPVAEPKPPEKPADKSKKKKAKADPAPVPPAEAPQVVPDPATAAPLPGTLAIPALLDQARDLAPEGDILRDVIADARSDLAPPAPVAEVTALRQAPNGATTFALPMAGQSYGEIGLLRLFGGPVTLKVTDAAGNPVCQDQSAGPSALCGFVPRESDRFLVTIANDGSTAADYLLITN